nr:uncharacterized protein LOC113689246 [Coffea arabica]
MPRTSSFRLAAKNIFITYSRCDVSKELCLEKLLDKFTNNQPSYVRVSSELHEDGTPHLHVLVQFADKFQTRDDRVFDLVCQQRSQVYHPNIQAARDARAVRDYISKYEDFCEWGTFKSSKIYRNQHECYTEAPEQETIEDFMNTIKEGDPKSYCIYYDRIKCNAEKLYSTPTQEYTSPFPLADNVPYELLDWANTNIKPMESRPNRLMSIIVEDPSRLGKTIWARSLGPHNYLCGHLDLNNKVYSNDVWYNVINDINPQYLKHYKEFIGAQGDWVSNCKYGKPVLIRGGIPAIMLCNPGPDSSYRDYLDRADKQALRD